MVTLSFSCQIGKLDVNYPLQCIYLNKKVDKRGSISECWNNITYIV